MPIAIIVVIIAVAGAIGFTVLRDEAPATEPEVVTTEAARPAEEEAGAELVVGEESDVESDASASSDFNPDLLNEELPTDAFTSGVAEPIPEPLDTPVVAGIYTDGSYTVETSYFTPARTEHEMDITLVVENDVVTDATIIYDGGAPSTGHHRRFDSAYKSAVIGVPLASISLSRVGGASLTSESFNEAVDTIQQQAS